MKWQVNGVNLLVLLVCAKPEVSAFCHKKKHCEMTKHFCMCRMCRFGLLLNFNNNSVTKLNVNRNTINISFPPNNQFSMCTFDIYMCTCFTSNKQ